MAVKRVISALILLLVPAAYYPYRTFSGTDKLTTSSNTMALVTGTSTVTFSAWLYYTTQTPNYQNIALYGNKSFSGAFNIEIQKDSGLCSKHGWGFEIMTANSFGSRRVDMADYPSMNAWHHIAAIMHSNTDTGQALYLDGVSQTVTNCNLGSVGTPVFTDATQGYLTLMNDLSGGGPTAGSMAHVAVFDRALLSGEIQALASGCLPDIYAVPPAVSGNIPHFYYWPLWGVDSPEPNYGPRNTNAAGLAYINMVVTGTTAATSGPPVHDCKQPQ